MCLEATWSFTNKHVCSQHSPDTNGAILCFENTLGPLILYPTVLSLTCVWSSVLFVLFAIILNSLYLVSEVYKLWNILPGPRHYVEHSIYSLWGSSTAHSANECNFDNPISTLPIIIPTHTHTYMFLFQLHFFLTWLVILLYYILGSHSYLLIYSHPQTHQINLTPHPVTHPSWWFVHSHPSQLWSLTWNGCCPLKMHPSQAVKASMGLYTMGNG